MAGLTAEDGETTMCLCDVVDQLLDEHGFSDAGTSKETNLSTSGVGGEKVDDLDAGLEDLSGGGLVDERRRVGMDGRELHALDGTAFVDGLANDVHDSAEGGCSDGDHDGCAGVDDLLATNETLCAVHCDGADRVFTQMGGDLEHETAAMEILDLEGVEDGGEVVGLELDVDHGADDGLDRAYGTLGLGCIGAHWKGFCWQLRGEMGRQAGKNEPGWDAEGRRGRGAMGEEEERCRERAGRAADERRDTALACLWASRETREIMVERKTGLGLRGVGVIGLGLGGVGC